jgi:hypothetical protein
MLSIVRLNVERNIQVSVAKVKSLLLGQKVKFKKTHSFVCITCDYTKMDFNITQTKDSYLWVELSWVKWMSRSQEVKGKTMSKFVYTHCILLMLWSILFCGQRTFLEPACAELYIVVRMAVHFKCVRVSKLVHAITSSCMQEFSNNMNLVF